jgi:hypothetical protein
MPLPDGRRLVSVPESLSGHVLMSGTLSTKSDGDLLVIGVRPPGARPAGLSFRAAGRLQGIRDAVPVPSWLLPMSAGRPIALPEGAWAVAKPGDLVSSPPKGPEPVVGAYHIAMMGSWHRIVDEQSDRLIKSGLLARTERVFIGVVGGEMKPSDLRPELATKAVISCHPDLKRYEFHTLKMLRDHAEGREFKAWYMHTKGASRKDEGVKKWRNLMEYFVIDKFEHCIQKLSLCDGCGTNLRTEKRYFAGNFWWSKSSYLSRLPKIESLNQTNRFEAELWIGKKPRGNLFSLFSGDYYS